MIKSSSFFAFVLASTIALGQSTWHVKLPFHAVSPVYANLYPANNSHFVSTQQRILQFGDDGTVIGSIDNQASFVTSVFAKKDPQTNRSYFYICRRGTAPAKYYLSRYEPGEGIVKEQVFEDSLFSFNKLLSPTIVSVNDSSFLVFGNKYARRISYHSNSNSFDEDWKMSVDFEPTSAVLDGNKVVVCGLSGTVKAFDFSGNLLWEKFYPFEPTTIKLLSDGYVLTGVNNLAEPVLLRLDLTGNLLWDKILSAKSIAGLTQTPDGGFAFIGQAVDNKAFLLKTNGLGELSWTKTFDASRGLALQNGVDGGLIVLYQDSQNSLYLMKTTDYGDAPQNQTPVLLDERSLNNGGISFRQKASSSLFFIDFGTEFYVPADSLTNAFSVFSPWISGIDEANNLHISVSTYGELFGSDYRLGIASSVEKDFNRVWSVEKESIAKIRKDFAEDGDLDNSPPADILTWPARGNPHFQQNLDFTLVSTNPDSLPASFVDFNGDNIYNVFDGDYPEIHGDRMLWWAITDMAPHQGSQSQPLGVDILISAFAYDCPQNENIWKSVFVEYEIINRNSQSFPNTYLGFSGKPMLGCPDDDYSGAIPEANTVFVYNQDAIDGQPGNTCEGDIATFGAKVPIESITMLNNSMDGNIHYYRGSGIAPAAQTAPVTPIEFFNYLQSVWRDGTPLTVGGTGYNPQDPLATPTSHIFPDNPADPQGWSMCTSNIPLGDRRMVNAHGPFIFAAGDTFLMRLAFTFHADIPHPCPNVQSQVKSTIAQIQQWNDDGTLEYDLDLGGVQTLPTGQSITLNATVPSGTVYLWSTGASTASISVSQPGEYSVTVTRASGCDLVETVLVKSASGVQSPNTVNWQVHPNPATEILQIILDGAEQPVTAILRNAFGQMALQKSSNGAVLDLNVIQLPAGLYWVELWRGGQFLGTKKVVLAKD